MTPQDDDWLAPYAPKPKTPAASPSLPASGRTADRERFIPPDADKWSIDNFDQVGTRYRQQFGRAIPTRAFGQGNIHNSQGWDHRNAVDVPIDPNSDQGKWILNDLRSNNVPFQAMYRAIKNPTTGRISSTGPHIHVGLPSHSTTQRFPVGTRLTRANDVPNTQQPTAEVAPPPQLPDDSWLDDYVPTQPTVGEPSETRPRIVPGAPVREIDPPQPVAPRPTAPRDLRQTVRRMVPRTPPNIFHGGTVEDSAAMLRRNYRGTTPPNANMGRVGQSPQPRLSSEAGAAAGDVRALLAGGSEGLQQRRMTQRRPSPRAVSMTGRSDTISNADAQALGLPRRQEPVELGRGVEYNKPAHQIASEKAAQQEHDRFIQTLTPKEQASIDADVNELVNSTRVGGGLKAGLSGSIARTDLTAAGIMDWLNLGGKPGESDPLSARRQGQIRLEVLRRAADKLPESTLRGLAELAGGTPLDILRLAALSQLPGGAITGFGVDAAAQAAGEGRPAREVVARGAQGALTGGVFHGAGGMPLIPRVATVGAGTAAVDTAFNGGPDPKSILTNMLFGALPGGKGEARPGERVTEAPPVENLAPESAPRVPEVVQDLPPNLRDNAERKAPVVRTAPLSDRQAVRESVTEPPVEAARPKETAPAATPERGSLPEMRPGENFRRPLAEFGPTVYRETGAREANMVFGRTMADMTPDRPYFANTPELALGQGKNKGILMEFDTEPLQGNVNISKPTWEPLYRQGQAEFIGNLNKQEAYRKALKAVTIKPDFTADKVEQAQMRNAIGDLKEKGWTETQNTDGSVTYRRPVSVSSETPKSTPAPQVSARDLQPKRQDFATVNDFMDAKIAWTARQRAIVEARRRGEVPIPGAKVAEVIQRPVDEAPAVAPERVAIREPKVVKPPREVVRESAKREKVNARTGLTPTQTDYVAGELEKNFDRLRTANADMDQVGRRSPLEIDVPGDGKFVIPTQEGANKLHQKITGQPIEGQERAEGASLVSASKLSSALPGGKPTANRQAALEGEQTELEQAYQRGDDAELINYAQTSGFGPKGDTFVPSPSAKAEDRAAVPASEREGAAGKAEGPAFEDQISERHAGFPFLSRLFSLPRARQDTIGKGSAVVDPNSTAEARMEAAKGIKQPGWALRGKDAVLNFTHAMRRTFPALDPKKDQVHAVATDLFRQLEAAPAFAKATAADKIAHITANLGPERTKLLERASILPDIMKDVEAGLYDGKDLPFGFKDKTDLQKSLGHYTDLVDDTPAVKDALARRQTFVKALTKELVNLNLLSKDALKDDRYFHRQVMAYVNDPAFMGTSSRDARMSQKGFQRGRTGGGDFNTRYVEAEFEWVSQALEQISRKTVLDRMNQAGNIQPDLVRQAEILSKQTGKKVDWQDLIPEGYRIWQPKKGNFFYPATSITERTLDNLLTSGRALEMDDVKEILALGGKRPEWVVPEGIAKTLDTFGQKVDEGAFGAASAQIMGMWKQWVLLSPPRATKYMLNNLSGDLDVTMAYDPKIVTYAPKAAKDLYQYHVKGKGMSPDVAEAMKDGVIGSGLTVSEIPDINKVGAFQLLTTDKPNLLMRGVERYWHGVKTFNDWRENTLRLSAYRYFIDKLGKGEKIYGASSKKQIDMLRSAGLPDREIAAKLARELIGDYGGVSHGGQYIRRHLIPFYSWVEINAPRYARMLRNAPFEESGGTARKARTVGVAAGRSAWKLGKYAVKANLLLLLAAAWNRSMYPDEEEEMRKTDQGRVGHIILGKRPDGSIRTMRVQGALSDALDWFGTEDYPSDVEDVLMGKATWQDKAADAVKAPVEKVVGGLHPGFKSPFELIAGESTYPHIFGQGTDFGFRTTQIRDRKEYVARLFSLDGLYRRVTGRPKPPTDPSTMGTLADWTFAYRTDPGEAAYWNARSNAFEYGRKHGKGEGGGEPTERGNALYYYKQAVKWSDKEAAARYLKAYFALGGSEKGMEQSIRMGHPLGSIAKKHQQEYIDSLSKDQKDELEAAIKFYEGTYGTKQERSQERATRRNAQPSATVP